MIYRAIVFYVVVQAAVVVASPTSSLQYEPITSPIGGGTFYHPTPASKARTIPELGKIPRPAKKVLPATTAGKLQLAAASGSGSHHHLLSRGNGRNPVLEARAQPPRLVNLADDPRHRQPQRLSSMTEAERAEKINTDLEKLIQFMTVLGQVDRYLTTKARSFVSTLGRAMENNPEDRVMPSYDY